MTDHAKAGLKKGGIKAIAKGGATAVTAGGAAVLGGAALPAVGAAALIGAAAGFGAGTVKSVGMERLKDWNRDYTTMEGITNELPKDLEGTVVDDALSTVGHSLGDDDSVEAANETDADVGTGENEYFNGDEESGNDPEE